MAKPLSEYKPVYLIYGDQDIKVEQALEALKREVGELADLDFNSETFDGESANADEVVAACNTLPFASERRLVVVRNVDKMDKAGSDRIIDYVADPAETTILALVAKKIAKNTRLYKAVDKLKGVLERQGPGRSEWPQEVQKIFAARGRNIPVGAAELLVSYVGRDLRRIGVESDKVIGFAGDRAQLTREDVEAVVARTAKASIFDFTGALANRDCATAFRLMEQLLGDGESIFGLHALSLRTIRDLIAVSALVDRGEGATPMVAAALGRPDWMVKNLPRQVRAFRPGELVEILKAAADTEGKMKTSRDPRLAFERWIVKVCG